MSDQFIMKLRLSLIILLLINPTILLVEGNDNLPKTYAPTQSRTKTPPYPWHRNITATFLGLVKASLPAIQRITGPASMGHRMDENFGG